jgi:hypothetical protein
LGEVRRMSVPRTPLNKGIKRPGLLRTPVPILERTVGLEPTPPYVKYGALRSCVRNNPTTLYLPTAAGISARWHIFGD